MTEMNVPLLFLKGKTVLENNGYLAKNGFNTVVIGTLTKFEVFII